MRQIPQVQQPHNTRRAPAGDVAKETVMNRGLRRSAAVMLALAAWAGIPSVLPADEAAPDKERVAARAAEQAAREAQQRRGPVGRPAAPKEAPKDAPAPAASAEAPAATDAA